MTDRISPPIPVVKLTLREHNDNGYVDATPSERIAMVWQMTLDAWSFLDPDIGQSEFQRHVVRVERRGS